MECQVDASPAVMSLDNSVIAAFDIKQKIVLSYLNIIVIATGLLFFNSLNHFINHTSSFFSLS